MDSSIGDFYVKNPGTAYAEAYERDHGPRLDAMLAHWGLLEKLKGKRVLDVGGGLGFLGKRLDPSTEYWVIDGAEVKPEQRLCKGSWLKTDLDHDSFGHIDTRVLMTRDEMGYIDWNGIQFDVAFCLETLEHLTNPYNALVEIKKLLKPDGDLIVSLPHENVWHNAIYPALLWPEQNWEQFLGQMALPIKARWFWDKGWNARHWWLKNQSWDKKIMLYPKQEAKFVNATPVEMVNW